MTRLAVVVGSVRPNRVGGTIAQWVVDQANTIEGVEAEIVDIASFNLPLFAEEIPPRMAVPSDPAGAAFDEALKSFDALIFVTPEYNFSIPGALKNAIDFLQPGAVANKGVGVVGYSYSVGIRAVSHLQQILQGMGATVVASNVFLSLNTDFADGADYGRILCAFAAGPDDVELTEHMDRLGYSYNEETTDPAFRFFLAR